MKRENAAAIRAYDYLAALSFGSMAALTAWWLIPASLPAPLAMLLGMGVGLMSAFPLLALFTLLLGGFEIVMMSMQIGMFAGMAGVMAGEAALVTAVLAGALMGLVVHVLLHVTDRVLHGEVRRHV